METVKYRSSYPNYDPDAASVDSGLKCEDRSLAVQSQAEEADINVIVKRFGITGQLPESIRIPEYGDFRGPESYQAAMEYVAGAQSAFMELPAALRAEFNNDPGEFLAYVSDPLNAEAVRDTLGIEIEGLQAPEKKGDSNPTSDPTPSPEGD